MKKNKKNSWKKNKNKKIKKRKTYKRLKGGAGNISTDPSFELVETTIRKIFDESIFDIEFRRISWWLDVTIYKNDQKDFACLILRVNIKEKFIRVESLDRCDVGNEGTGNAMLRKVNELALSLPEYNSIKLIDGSSITLCDTIVVNLAHLKILTKGMSWYNSHGYFSDKYDEEVRHNNIFITSKIHEIQAPSVFTEVNETDTVQAYVSRILESIPSANSSSKTTKCSEAEKEQANHLKNVVEVLSPLLMYDNKLKKTIDR